MDGLIYVKNDFDKAIYATKMSMLKKLLNVKKSLTGKNAPHKTLAGQKIVSLSAYKSILKKMSHKRVFRAGIFDV